MSSFGSGDGSSSTIVAELPWGGVKLMGPSLVDVGVKPGEYVAQTLLVEFMTTAEKKINLILQDSLVIFVNPRFQYVMTNGVRPNGKSLEIISSNNSLVTLFLITVEVVI